MNKIYTIVIGLMLANPVWAANDLAPLLNKVTLQLRAEQWVTTTTALVSVGVNASVSSVGIEKVQKNVLSKLGQLSGKSDWHIVSFNRSQDPSGLESIQIIAEARLQQGDLAGLRDKAKAITVPGETYTIENVQFTPSDDEFRQAASALRGNIYAQAKAEVEAINKQSTEQQYFIHQIDFMQAGVMTMEMGYANKRVSAAMSAPSMNVGNKEILSARVELAAVPAPLAQVFKHD